MTSVGVDIGSSTSHLLFSRLELQRDDGRYVTTRREVLYASEILLTPYTGELAIDQAALGSFVDQQYRLAGLSRAQVDTGALILTGVALIRRNARAIAELFAEEAGRFVAVSAGDNLESIMAAHGSGAVAISSRIGQAIVNLDLGGGTTKVAICRGGRVDDVLTLDVGARLLVRDERDVVVRLEQAGRRVGQAVGLDLTLGALASDQDLQRMADYMADQLVKAIGPSGTGDRAPDLLRTPAVPRPELISAITLSGGVAEFIYDRESGQFGDLGPALAAAIRERAGQLGAPIVETRAGIRATAIGASQYTVQVSGSTIFLNPPTVVPLRNVPVAVPSLAWGAPDLEASEVAEAVRRALSRLDLLEPSGPVALGVSWQGSATYDRLQAFCEGVSDALRAHLERGHPLVLAFDGDVGGLVGLHFREELGLKFPIVSIDGLDLREFDYLDVGDLLPASGAVPVVIKSLVFPSAPMMGSGTPVVSRPGGRQRDD